MAKPGKVAVAVKWPIQGANNLQIGSAFDACAKVRVNAIMPISAELRTRPIVTSAMSSFPTVGANFQDIIDPDRNVTGVRMAAGVDAVSELICVGVQSICPKDAGARYIGHAQSDTVVIARDH